MGRPNPIFLEQQDVYLSLTDKNTTTTSSPIVDVDYFVIPNSNALCASIISQNTFQNTTQPIPAGWRKISDINVSTDNCGPYKFVVSGQFSQYFAVYNSSLYINELVSTLPSRTYSITVSIVDIANRFNPTSRTFVINVSSCVNRANVSRCAVWDQSLGNFTTVGSNGGPSAYGTFDQDGNIKNWIDLDSSLSLNTRGVRGNHSYQSFVWSYNGRALNSPDNESYIIGLRVSTIANPLNLANFVDVGDIGNSADPRSGFGTVNYAYKIGKYHVTNCEYAEFLNAVAKTDTYGLYNTTMASDIFVSPTTFAIPRGGIIRTGSSGNYQYFTRPNMWNKPVAYISWFDCARYCNWLHNGKPSGIQNNTTTENGAYTLNGKITPPAVLKNANALYWIPTENEWYKVTYYKGGGTNAGYWNYGTQSDIEPSCVAANSTGDGPFTSQYVCGFDYATTITTTTTTTTVAPITTTTTSTTTGQSYIGYAQIPYGNGMVGSFGNVVGTEDLFDPNFSTVFIQACNLITFFTSNPSILVLQSGDTNHMSRLLSVLSNFSSNVSSTSQSWSTFTNQNNLINNRALVIIPFNYNWNTGDMPLSGQNAIINYVQNGGKLLTTEWFHWLLAIGKMASLIPLSPCVPTSMYSTVTNMTFSKFNLSNQSIQFASSPSSFSWSPSRLSPLQGSHTHLNSLRNGATKYWSLI